MVKTARLEADSEGISSAAAMLREGRLVAFPTETVYGLGADASNDVAVARVFEAKGRPSFNPLIAHVADTASARELCAFSELADRLAQAFWPGPLTLVLPMHPTASISKLVTAGGDLLAIRVPESPVARRLLAEVGRPVAAPSANPSGRISPTTAVHVIAGLDGKIDAVLDGGPCAVGLESTIVGFGDGPQLLRAGGIPQEALEECLGASLLSAPLGDMPTAPGQLASHYAPKQTVRLNAVDTRPGEVLIGFSTLGGDMNLSAAGDLLEAAARLFDYLHEADLTGAPIAVASIPETGLGRAINDRLRRAAAPRT